MAFDPVAEKAAGRNSRQFPKRRTEWDMLTLLWRGLRHPWFAAIVLLTALLLGVAALTLPQLPGQLVDEPATAARRLIATSDEFGTLGDLYRALGLFDVAHSLLLRLTLALLALIAFVHLGDLLSVARQMRGISASVRTTPIQPDAPLPLPGHQTIARQRAVFINTPQQNAESLAAFLARRFDTVERHDPDSTESIGVFGGDETRFAALRHARAAMVRPLVAVGVLVALAGAWTATTFGWNVSTGLLAPGATYRSAARDVQIDYGIGQSEATNDAPMLAVRVGDEQAEHAVDGDRSFNMAQGTVVVQTGAPGVQIVTDDGAPALLRAGESVPSPEIGLVFPTPGSEESILLPQYATGVRIVRMPSENDVQYAVEVYRSDSLGAAEREVIDASGEHVIPLPNGPALRFRFMPAIEVELRAFPGRVAMWIGLGLALLGVPAFFRRPGYLVLQLRPWHEDHTLLIAQSNTHAEIEAVTQVLAMQPWSEGSPVQPVSQTPTMVAR